MKLRFKGGAAVRYNDRLLAEGDIIDADASLVELVWFESAEEKKEDAPEPAELEPDSEDD